MIRIKIRRKIDKRKYTLYAVMTFIVILAVWSLVSGLELIEPIFLPTPLSVLKYAIKSARDGVLWLNMGVSAELVAASSGLGYSILKAQRFVKTDAIFSGIIIIGILGLVTDRIFAIINKRLFKWREGGA